jgi:hypothetical protein
MEGHLEALLEMDFCTKPPNFGVEAHMEAPAGDALSRHPANPQKLFGGQLQTCKPKCVRLRRSAHRRPSQAIVRSRELLDHQFRKNTIDRYWQDIIFSFFSLSLAKLSFIFKERTSCNDTSHQIQPV